MGEIDAQVAMVAALAEPIRPALYRYVVSQPEPVSRERAAAGVGVGHYAAKFHLDKLEDDGLLEAEYRRPPGRGGRGAGRPAKLCRRSSGDIAVSLVRAEKCVRAAQRPSPGPWRRSCFARLCPPRPSSLMTTR